jgi:transcriptional regulator with XRE-family HTH domain
MSSSPENAFLGLAIRHFRSDLGISQEELANRAGIHRTYVGGIERGTRNPSYASIVRIADALQIPASRIIEYAEARTE